MRLDHTSGLDEKRGYVLWAFSADLLAPREQFGIFQAYIATASGVHI